ncbi:hypothetical protein FPOAC2_14372 [Fusarium poae]|uniref:YCII-related domain-containing protein n=1 Tax=Fusarium poae TaxID=36050 RepID=A0A1B8A4T9_FUSPO|nr:uncharacterized protein FPOAC1_013097 [Fusarium poae]KAG8665119.1 hypothetical protein FPOAC1_013097 [Fusarium poae]OBS15493.1 hypothetical protein FPOA_13684 [Fusarium poae]
MASGNTATQNYEWIIRLPLHVGGESGIPVSREQIIEHRERTNREPDYWLCAGVVVENPAADLHEARFKYSTMIVSAPSKEDVLARLRDDCLYPAHWDVDNAEIEPFISVIRKGIDPPVVDGNLPAK